ncbi:hypothetical protein MLD38_017316 [Melastoma candidum]|uniref:Uncharacterized protein n=1 Tax=Melastoma candidum TaxID=119954 RepID=A0ACB9QPN5_9MYRT|nr:hypothetical protein MLD38_017316 [Melastoma candidum]
MRLCGFGWPVPPTKALPGITSFDIKLKNVNRLCHTKSMVTANGKFSGSPVVAREGDRLLIGVTNHVHNNMSIHWHGIRQLRSGWDRWACIHHPVPHTDQAELPL